MTDSTPDGLDSSLATRLRELAAAEAEETSPWPGLDGAVHRSRIRRMVAGGTVALLCAAGVWFAAPIAIDGLDSAAPVAGPGSPTETTGADPAPLTVGDYFDTPGIAPGPAWTRYGEPVLGLELYSTGGSEQCGWQSAVIVHLAWPVGTVSQTGNDMRQFIRDPQGVISTQLQAELRTIDLPQAATSARGAAGVPPNAADTGYRLEGLALWLSPTDPDGIYIVSPGDVERWPRADPVVDCG